MHTHWSHPVDSASLDAPVARGLPDFADIRRVYQFVVMVESTAQSAAAKQLFLTQQGLSSSLRQLERDLGVQLFNRTRRNWSLTEAGQSLYADARPLIARNQALVRRVHSAAAPKRASLYRIGHSPLIPSTLVAQFAKPAIGQFPECAFNAESLPTPRMIDMVLDGRVDLGLILGYARGPDIATTTVSSTAVRVAVASDSILAKRPHVTLRDLAKTPIVVQAEANSSPFTRLIVAHCHCAGFEPELVVNPLAGMPAVTCLEMFGDASVLVTLEEPRAPGIRLLPVSDLPSVPIQAAWLAESASAIRTAMLSARIDETPQSQRDSECEDCPQPR